MEPRAPTPKEAQRWLLIYDFFNTHEKATFEGWSSIDFENDLKDLGREVWATDDTLEIVAHLKEVAEAGKVVGVDEALVPANIDELVSEHLAALAAEKKTEGVKPATARNVQSIAELARQEKVRQLTEALQTVIGRENAQKVAPLLERRLTEAAFRGEVITEDQLERVVSSALSEILPEYVNEPTVKEAALKIAGTDIVQKKMPQGTFVGTARAVLQRHSTPSVKEVLPKEDVRAVREAQLLLRVSYLRASVVKQFFTQLGALSPLRLLNIIGGTSYANSHPLEAGVQSLLLKGITIRLLREAITRLKEQTPGIAPNDHRLLTLEEIITAMEAYQSSHPSNYAAFESRAADSVEIATPGEEVTPTLGKMLRLRSIFDQAGKFQFLRIDTLSLKKGIRALPGIIGRAVSYPFLSAARVFFGRPAGGILHAFGGSRSVAVREAGFGVQRGLVNFAKGAFRQLGSFVSDVFTRPALGWLRWGLAGGFGLGALTLPFPFNFLSGGISGLTGATQLAHSAPSAGSFLNGLRNRFGAGAGGGMGISRSRLALGLPMAILAPILVIPVLAFMVINGAQGTFQGIGGAGTGVGPGSEFSQTAENFVPPPIDLSSLTFYWPLPNPPTLGTLQCTSWYGWRILGTKHFHNGIDISAGPGTPITPIADGTIYQKGNDGLFGNFIIVGHTSKPYSLYSLYAHMRYQNFAAGLKVNDTVIGGQTKLGEVDSTGESTGDHLHLGVARSYSLKEGGEFLNSNAPAAFFPCDYLKNYCSRADTSCFGGIDKTGNNNP